MYDRNRANADRQFVYLHGYATSPESQEARDLTARFAALGITLHVPDLNVPDFEHLTLTAMLARVAEAIRALPPGPVGLMGSSLGGLTALHFADRYQDAEAARVERLLLVAPALDYVAIQTRHLGAEGLARWRDTGWLDTFHWAENAPKRLHYGLVEDVQGYDSWAFRHPLPTLIYHGTRDESVDPQQSVRFAASRPYVELRLLDGDHRLLDQTDTIWAGALGHFGL